jgi:hypothetical protein
MTTASGGVAVIATQLAQTDRRALSEAWYSALHLTRDAAAPRARTMHGEQAPAAHAATTRGAVPHAGQRGVATSAPPRARRDASALATAANERRRPVSETARRIERAVQRLAAMPGVPAAHTIDVDGGRIRLLVHHDGRSARLVALCSGPLREQVERALASARFALAGAGLAVGAP